MERIFENFLWKSRLVVLAAVIISLVSSLAMFYMLYPRWVVVS